MARLSKKLASCAAGALLMLTFLSPAAEHRIATNGDPLVVQPIQHAGLLLSWGTTTIYADPFRIPPGFKFHSRPDIVLITDVHDDHMDIEALQAVVATTTQIIAPSAVASALPAELAQRVVVLANGETKNVQGVEVTAVPMYNLYERKTLHPKGRGNGYVVELGGKRIYVSGDTDDIPEMRALERIDVAFLSMIPPYTMSVEQAADAVKDFRPKLVFPYHYQDSDVKRFKSLVEQHAPDVEVRLDNWYPQGI